jgi:hypothetical protein
MNDVFSIPTNISQGLIRLVLDDETFFGDSSPRWKHQPTSQSVILEREARARLFHRHGAEALSRILAACTPNHRCRSGACPECGRAIQRFFVRKIHPLLRPTNDFLAVSIVPGVSFEGGALSDLTATSFLNDFADRLSASSVHFAVGGMDFTFNEHRNRRFIAHWSPHFWFLTNRYNRVRWEALLRRTFVRTLTVPRPIKIQLWDGRRAALGYALKTQFGRRISRLGYRQYGDGTRRCKITCYDRLRSAERFELYTLLAQIGLGSRILLIGIDTQHWPVLRLSE